MHDEIKIIFMYLVIQSDSSSRINELRYNFPSLLFKIVKQKKIFNISKLFLTIISTMIIWLPRNMQQIFSVESVQRDGCSEEEQTS